MQGHAFLCLMCTWLACVNGLQISIIMQGSDYINVSLVPDFDVNQFDLGDVFLSPCREGSFSNDRSGVCRPCSTCGTEQFVKTPCLTVQDSQCANCTTCGPREMERCQCGNTTSDCYLGDRICTPLLSVSVNITFIMTAGAPLNSLLQRFLVEGMNTGFVLYLSRYLDEPYENIQLLVCAPRPVLQYVVTYVILDVYKPSTLALIRDLSDDVVQSGLSSTFGTRSNTFVTRRRLLASSISLLASDTVASCVLSDTSCPQFFTMLNTTAGCGDNMCVALPCPAGFTGDFGQCTPCPNATFKESSGSAACTPCPAGFTSNEGSVSIGECRYLPTPAQTTTAGPQQSITGPPLVSTRVNAQGLSSTPPPSTTAANSSPSITPLRASTSSPGSTSTSTLPAPLPPTASSAATSTPVPPPVPSPPVPSPPIPPPPGPPPGPPGPPSGGGNQYTTIVHREKIIIEEGVNWPSLALSVLIVSGWAFGAYRLWQGIAEQRPADAWYMPIPTEPPSRPILRYDVTVT